MKLLQIAADSAAEAVSFHVVHDGEQAMAYLNGERPYADRHAHPFPSLVLLDLSLPGMSGFDVLGWIRGHEEFGGLKVYVWTDAGDPVTLDRAIKAGATRFVPKSVSFVRGGLSGLVRGIWQEIMTPDGKEQVSVVKA